MSFQIPRAFVQAYESQAQHLGQQMGSRLQVGVDVAAGITGTRANFEQIGTVSAQLRTARHGDTPLTNADHPRRIIDLDYYELGQLYDPQDDPKILIDPRNKYMEAARMALGRKKDEVILAAANGTSTIGSTGHGVTGSTGTEAFSNTFTIADGGGTTFAVADLITAKTMLREAEVAMDGEPLYCACSAQTIADLLSDSGTQSIDTNTVRALVQGDVASFMGFTFLVTELVSGIGGPSEVVYFWHKNGIKLGIGQDMTGRMAEDPGKSFAWVVYNGMYIGATRMQTNSVVTTTVNHT